MSDIEILKADLELVVRDKDDKEIERHEGPSHSWVKNFYQYIFCQCAGIHQAQTTYNTHLYDTAGATDTSASIIPWGFSSASSDGSWANTLSITGCTIGSGTGVESFTDYALGTKIADGTGSGQIQYGLGSFTFSTASAGTILRNKIDRTFTNNSGGTVSISETGLYGRLVWTSLKGNSYFMLNRDTFSAVNVANGNSLYVSYTIKITLPEAIV